MTNQTLVDDARKLLDKFSRLAPAWRLNIIVEAERIIGALLDALTGQEGAAPSPRAEPPEATVVEPWKPVRIGKKHTYFQCPRCRVARVTEWCPPPCNTQSLAFKRTKESR